ncbi:hypothetical protein IKQ74_01395 [Candidatus Saccharibacteria bacterium]|jgi:hypothetical protein|nr:hypothetical protein [Candidatus Saccharibacteria bacterium]
MVLIVVFAALLLCFLLVRHHVGVPFLAMIAGITIYEHFGANFANAISNIILTIPANVADAGLYILFVAFVPILLYFRAGRSGLFGAMRAVESIIFAAMLTILLATPLVSLFSFDTLSADIANYIADAKVVILVVGILFAYVDTFLYRSGKLY